MKRFGYCLFGFCVAALLFLANISASMACALTHYQPEIPKSLRK